MLASDVPIPRRRPTKSRGVKADCRGDQVDGDRPDPERLPGRAGGEAAGNPEKPGDEGPDENALKTAPQNGMPGERKDGEGNAKHLNRHVRTGEQESALAKGFRQ